MFVVPGQAVERDPFNCLVSTGDAVQEFSIINPGEKRQLVFSFASDLENGALTLLTNVSPVVSITCLSGNDSDPSGIAAGAATVNGDPLTLITPTGGSIILPAQTAVVVPVQASMLWLASYLLKVGVQTSNPQVVPICFGRLINGPV